MSPENACMLPTSAMALLRLTSFICWADTGRQKCWNNLDHLLVPWNKFQ